MDDIKIFKNVEFGEVRALTVGNEPWFVGNDVAKALGYGDGKSLPNAINNHVDKEDKGVTKMMTPRRHPARHHHQRKWLVFPYPLFEAPDR